MNFKEFLNTFVEEAVLEDYPVEMSASLLLGESTRSLHDGATVLEMIKEEYGDDLTEAIKRIQVKVAGAGRITRRKIGRKDPRRSMIAKRSARKGRAARQRAMRNPRSKMKRKRTMQARSRMFGAKRRGGSRPRPKAKAYRGYHGAKRHAAPRRAPRPKVRRPTMRRIPRRR